MKRITFDLFIIFTMLLITPFIITGCQQAKERDAREIKKNVEDKKDPESKPASPVKKNAEAKPTPNTPKAAPTPVTSPSTPPEPSTATTPTPVPEEKSEGQQLLDNIKTLQASTRELVSKIDGSPLPPELTDLANKIAILADQVEQLERQPANTDTQEENEFAQNQYESLKLTLASIQIALEEQRMMFSEGSNLGAVQAPEPYEYEADSKEMKDGPSQGANEQVQIQDQVQQQFQSQQQKEDGGESPNQKQNQTQNEDTSTIEYYDSERNSPPGDFDSGRPISANNEEQEQDQMQRIMH